MSFKRWEEDLIGLGEMGRKNFQRVESQQQLDNDKGLYRIEGTPACTKSKKYVIERMKEIGLKVRIDRVGNIFARKDGTKTDKGSVMSGSHLDSVLNGGMFDGVLGVVSALEAVRRINDEGFENERPIEISVFMGEEGSAFKKVLLGSLMLVGKLDLAEALAMKDDNGISLKEALDTHGLRGDFEMNLNDVEYFIETHVEQGPLLDQEKISIGVVENITGMLWILAYLTGEENHAGTTPMFTRRDPLIAAAEIVLLANKLAKKMAKSSRGNTVATVGQMVVDPGAPNIIPGRVRMGIDIRDSQLEVQNRLKNELISAIENLDALYGIKADWEIPFEHKPQSCSQEVLEVIELSASQLGIPTKKMNSGAGHDAQNIAQKVKTAMIFVPSVNGISHSPFEWTHWEDVDKGIQVLTQTIKKLSRL